MIKEERIEEGTIQEVERKRFNFRPKFIRPTVKDAKSRQDAKRIAEASKKNTSILFSSVYNFYFGGKVNGTNEHGENGREYLCDPDIIRSDGLFGEQAIETKTASFRLSQFPCRQAQMGGYVDWTLERYLGDKVHRQKAPSVEYLFVRYGVRENQALHKSKDREFVPRLVRSINYALVVPHNLAIFLSTLSSLKPYNKGGEDLYFFINEGLTGLLRQEAVVQSGKVLDTFEREVMNRLSDRRAHYRLDWHFEGKKSKVKKAFEFGRKYLALQSLVGTQFRSDKKGDLFCYYTYGKEGHREGHYAYVQPFPIFRYELKKSDSWLKAAKKNYTEILERGLKIKTTQPF